MAVKGADAPLSGPKREDEHPESTSMRDLGRKWCLCALQSGEEPNQVLITSSPQFVVIHVDKNMA
jgi:hypothetical protein